MGGYSTITQSPEEFPQEIAGQMRKRGLIPALMGVQQQQPPAGTDRIQDEPVTRNNPEAYGATSSGQAPVGTSPTQRDTLSDRMMAEYERLGQPEAPPPQMSLKQRLLQGVLRAAPIAAGAAFGGSYGAMGAAQGEEQGIQNQQRMRLAQQQMAQQREQQRNSLRERMLQEMVMQQRMQQQSDIADRRIAAGEQRTQEMIGAGQQKQQTAIEQQNAMEQQKESARSAEQKETESAREASQARQFAQQSAMERDRFAQQMAMQNRQFGEQEKLLGMREQAKQQQLTPAAQGILQTTDPAKQMIDDLMQRLEPYKNSDKRLTMSRIGYSLGMKSPEGDLAADISALELNRVMSAARILKGSSRAYQALERAMVHTPNPWTDTTGLMYQKLQTIQKNLNDVEQDALRFGAKGQTVGNAASQLGQPTGSRAQSTGGAPLTIDEARQYLQRAGGDKDRARAMARQDGRTF